MKHLPSPGGGSQGPAPIGPGAPVPYDYVYGIPGPAFGGEADRAGLADYGQAIRRHWLTALAVVAAAVVAAVLLAIREAPVYQAHAVIEIQNLNENFLNMRDVNPTSTGTFVTPDDDRETNVKLLESHSLLERVAALLHLRDRFAEMGVSGRSGPQHGTGGPELTTDDVIALVAKNLTVKSQPRTRLVEISYDSTDPQLAANVANAVANEFIQQNLEARWQTAQHTGEWLRRQLEDLRIKLQKSEEQLQSYARLSGFLFTGDRENISEGRLRQIQQELASARADRVAKQSRYELAINTAPESLPEVLDSPILRDYQIKLTDLQRQYAELAASLTARHPKVQQLQAQVKTLETALDSERRNILGRIRNEFESALRREKLLAADETVQTRLVADQSNKIGQYNLLKREVDASRQMYETMLQRVKEAGLASALRASNIRVVDAATPPSRPYKPDVSRNAGLGLLAGVLLGAVAAVVRDRMQRTIHGPGDTAQFLNLSELAVIPRGRSDPERRRMLLEARAGERGGAAIGLAAHDLKKSMLAESFRAAIASILFAGENGDSPRVLVVSSPNPSEGKTTISTNLAIALAQVNRKVLLIDADLRRPGIHGIFKLERVPGFTDVLSGAAPLTVHATHVPNLFVLPSGSESDSALLYGRVLPELIRRLRCEFDVILFDTPPILLLTDARVLGRAADAVILVVRARRTTRDALALAQQRLSEDGANVLGTILNDWDLTGGRYGHRSYYNRYYRHYRAKTG